MTVTSYDSTQRVHDVLMENLKKEEARLATLLNYEKDVALQIEDSTRVILAVKRSIATLSVGIPPAASPSGSAASQVEPLKAASLSKQSMQETTADEADRKYHFTDEEAEDAYNRSLVMAQEA